jgi:molybdopterin-synthase adenylyltransferase
VKLRAASTDLAELHDALLRMAPEEGAAFVSVEPDAERLLIRDWRVFDRGDMEERFGAVSLREDVKVAALAAIKRRGHGLVEVHTHPGSGSQVGFSAFDLEQLPEFARYVHLKMPGRAFGALVFGELGYEGRFIVNGVDERLQIEPVGERGSQPGWIEDGAVSDTVDDRFDRQVRALGPDGQRRISSLRIGVIGLGGTGSLVVQQLAHLGVRQFVLVEDDRVERTNLARLAGATWWDASLRRTKARIARRTIRRIAPRAEVIATGHLRTSQSLQELKRVDLIVGCVDNDGTRLITSELAAAHVIPYLDIGVGIEGDGIELAMGGRVSFYLPGGPCLACADEIEYEEAAQDLESKQLRDVRIARGYASDRRIEPALMPLNTVVAGQAMLEFLAFATGVRRVAPFLRYEAVTNTLRSINVERDADCPVCGPASGMGSRQAIERYALR